MTSSQEAALQVSRHLRLRLARAGISLREADRRLGWPEGRLSRQLRRGARLRVADVYAVLDAAGIELRSFFSELFDLDARAAGPLRRETPYSSGLLSAEDAAEFPRPDEVVELIRTLVEEKDEEAG
jgi:hypothetical protein